MEPEGESSAQPGEPVASPDVVRDAVRNLSEPAHRRLAKAARAFLRGYDYAFTENRKRPVDSFLQEFSDWIHCRYQSTDLSWEEMILAHSQGETDAVHRFWELFDEFLREVPTDRAAANGAPPASAPSTPVPGPV